MNKTVKTTDLEDLLCSEEELKNYFDNKDSSKESKVHGFLLDIMKENNITRSEIITKADLNRVYAYEVFRGTKRPSRNILLRILISLDIDFDQIQKALRRLEYAPLYAKKMRDALIIFGIKNKKSVNDINIFLYDAGYDLI